jgi:integrase/recombinase XerD
LPSQASQENPSEKFGLGRDAATATIDQNVIDRFILSLQTASPRIAARTAIEHARRVVPERFYISTPCRHTPPDPNGPLLAAYLDHLRHVRGLEPKTCDTAQPKD